MLDWIQRAMEVLGYPGIVLLMFLENVFPPLPSELIMPLAGFTASQGRLSYPGVVLAGTAGNILGALPLYALGRTVGERRLTRLADRYGKWLTVSGEDITRAKGWFDRHGGKAVLICRLVPGVRSLISIPAGLDAMPLAPFLLYSALGTGLWAALLTYLGHLLGENYALVARYLGPAAYLVLGGLAVGIATRVWRRRRRRAAPDRAW